MKTRKNKSQTALINGILMSLCCLLSTQSLAADTDHDFKVAFSVVSNDNVYKMPDKAISGVSVEAGVGSLLDLSYDFTNEYQTKGDFFIAVDLSSEMYGSDGDADETVLSFKTGSANGYSLAGDNRIKTKAGVFYDRKDKTYVSRFTGLVPVSGGQELNDRFSYTQYGVFGNLDYYMGKATRVSLDIEYKTKDYAEDYVDIGRTNFDYSQWKIKPMIRHQINRELRVGFSLPLAFREYDDRSAQDLLGADIIPSDLEYDYKGLDLSLEYEPARNLSVEIGYKIQNREDNYEGALDYDRSTIYLKTEFPPDDVSRIALSYQSRDRDYDHATTGGVKRSVSKDDLVIEYERAILRNQVKGLSLRASYEDISMDHDSDFLTYDQTLVTIGIIWQPL